MEEKRKLPSWMVGVKKDENNNNNNNSNVSKALDLDDVVNKDEGVSEFVKPKAKRVAPRKKLSNEKGVLVKCGTKRKKRGLDEEDVIGCDDFEGGGFVERRKRGRAWRKGGENEVVREKEEERCEFDGGNENKDLYPSCGEEDDDDVDLTMEDLLSIAKEFVENDKSDMGQKKPAEEHCKLKSNSLYTSLAKTRNSLLASQDTRSHTHEETTSYHDSVENTASEVTLPDFQMTEDSTQDMLNLFLGPLLGKPITKQGPSPVKDITISHEIKNQRNKAVICDKPVTVTKKKSRLREAVAMLLDCESE